MPPRNYQIFSHTENIWIVTNYGEFKSPTALRTEFRKNFKLSPRQLPHSYAFFRVINRFMTSGDVYLSKLAGPPRTKFIEENIDTVRNLVEEKSNSSISDVSTPMNLSMCTVEDFEEDVERISISVLRLTDQHRVCRVHCIYKYTVWFVSS